MAKVPIYQNSSNISGICKSKWIFNNSTKFKLANHCNRKQNHYMGITIKSQR